MKDRDTIFKLLSLEFGCPESSIDEFELILNPGCNENYTFKVNGVKYVYRDANAVIPQRSSLLREYIVHSIAAMQGLAPKLFAFNVDDGWKISEYAEGHTLNYDKKSECESALLIMRGLHSLPVNMRATACIKDTWMSRIDSMEGETKDRMLSDEHFLETQKIVNQLWDIVHNHPNAKCLTHGDFRSSNIIIGDNTPILIDWEYANYDDPGTDFGAFICDGNFSEIEVESLLRCYLGRIPKKSDLIHYYAYIAFHGFYKYIATSFRLSKELREPVIKMHELLRSKSLKYVEFYCVKAMELIRQ